MARLSAQQRAEIVQLYLQGESVNAIVWQTGHDHKTVLRWVRRVTTDGSLQDKARSGRPLKVMTPTVVSKINQKGPAQSINAAGRCYAELSDQHCPRVSSPMSSGVAAAALAVALHR